MKNMILAIKYTNKTNPQDIQSSTYTSLAHKEYHEGQHPYLVSQYDQENVTQAEVQKIIIKQGLSNMAYGAELIAELRAYNLSAFLTGALTSLNSSEGLSLDLKEYFVKKISTYLESENELT